MHIHVCMCKKTVWKIPQTLIVSVSVSNAIERNAKSRDHARTEATGDVRSCIIV